MQFLPDCDDGVLCFDLSGREFTGADIYIRHSHFGPIHHHRHQVIVCIAGQQAGFQHGAGRDHSNDLPRE